MVKGDHHCEENQQGHAFKSEAEAKATDDESSGDDNADTVNSGSYLVTECAEIAKTIPKVATETSFRPSSADVEGGSSNSPLENWKKFLLKKQKPLIFVGFVALVTASTTVLFLHLMKTPLSEALPEKDRIILQFDKKNSQLVPAGNGYSTTTNFAWDTFLNHMGHLHFEVGGKDTRWNRGGFELKGRFIEQSLKILGRPSFCTEGNYQTPNSIVFRNVSHLYLHNMDNCHHYVHLILKEWRYPKVKHLKLHKVLIREEEFRALGKFIEKHNDTLTKVEIDESYLCPSPVCDAGMLNFPEHDFQLIIRRRKESPEWFY